MKEKQIIGLTLLSILVLTAAPSFVQAQLTAAAPKTTPSFVYLLNGMPLARPASGIIGNIYYNEEWAACTFTISETNQVIDGYDGRYNIYFDELDVSTNTGEKAIESRKIKNFTLGERKKSSFVNANGYTLDGTPLKGFLEVLVDGPVSLFKRHSLVIKDPDYNPALSAGSHDSKIIKEFELLYANGTELSKAKNKKKIMASFGDKRAQVESYLKANPTSFSDEAGLVNIFTYYNSLLTH